MEFPLHTTAIDTLETPLLGVPAFSDDEGRGEAFARVDALVGGLLSRIADEEGFKAEAGKRLLVHTPDAKARRVLVLGAGKSSDANALGHRALASTLIKEANGRKLASAALVTLDDAGARFAVEGALLGAYRYDKWKTRDNDPATCTALTLVVGDAAGVASGVALAAATAEGVCFARDLVNGPPVEVTPARLAEAATEIARANGLELKVFDKAEIIRRGMNLLMAVGVGSVNEPRFIHLTYRPKNATKDTPQVALVGKGVTFDSGGYSLKPSSSMEDMKMDMAGAAAVLGTMQVVAKAEVPYIVHGIVPSAENLVNGEAYKVGDIVRSLNGKTVEVMNTDAEGRLLLADALTYTEGLDVDRVIDLATLTGACVVALGPHTAGLFASDKGFGDKVKAAGDAVGEDFWPMPLNEKLKPMLKTPNADMKNVGARWGGAITAALFLKEFAGDKPWCHLDIAGPAFADKPDGPVPKGGTGFAVMTLVELLRGEV